MVDRNGTILIADDEEPSRRSLNQRLKSEGFRCDIAENAGKALTYLARNPTDLLLLDIKILGKSRTELLPEIKKCFRDIVVITITDAKNKVAAIESLSQGAYDYVTKPFNIREVVHTVKRALEKKRLELEFQNLQRHLEQRMEEQAKDIREAFLGAMVAMSYALEAKDIYTAGHSHRVTEIAIVIGKKLAITDDELADLRWGSLLHDIGNIAVDQLVVNKNGKLTPEEYEHVMGHVTIGANILEPVIGNKRITEVIRYHHAHYDGSGHNQKLIGKEIPLLARIVAVADAYDAMISNRPHRAARTKEAALAEIRWGIGRQFDPDVANLFLEMSETGTISEKEKVCR
jgi:response regulator RpfG family c-di-GMP phosphodiesterase